MTTFEATVIVGEDRKLLVQLPEAVKPGRCRIVVIVEEEAGGAPEQPLQFSAYPVGPVSDDFPVIDVGPWPEGVLLRREDMYGDDGR
jgi:hypothetical protein